MINGPEAGVDMYFDESVTASTNGSNNAVSEGVSAMAWDGLRWLVLA